MWSDPLDKVAAFIASLMPISIVLGNVAFELVLVLVGLIWIVRSFDKRENPLPYVLKHPLGIPCLCWFATVLVSRFLNFSSSHLFVHDVTFLRNTLFVFALLDLSRRQPIARYLAYGLLASVIWAVLNTLSAHILGYDFIGNPLGHYTGKLNEAGRIAGLMVYTATFCFSWGLRDRNMTRRMRILVLVLGVFGVLLILKGQSRTGLIAAACGTLVAIAYSTWQRRSLIALIFFGILVLVGFAVLFQSGEMGSFASFYDRIYYWKVCWALWLENPLFGVGISSFKEAYRQVAASGVVEPFIAPDGQIFHLALVSHAHNLVLQLLTCTGLLGLAIFTWLFVNACRLIAKNHEGLRLGLIPWPVVFLVVGLTGWNIYDPYYTSLFVYFLGLIGAGPGDEAPLI
jgi:O-antigen ligase